MSLFNSFTLTVNRNSGSYVNGRWVTGPVVPFQIQTSWQALTGEDLESLPSGKRAEFSFKGYPKILLKTADPKTGNPADIIIGPDGYNYEVITVEPWQNNVINHYKFVATRIKEGS